MTMLRVRPRRTMLLCLVTLIANALVACGGGGGGGGGTTTYSISGTVGGAIVNGVTVTLSGAAARSTTTDLGGNYSFTGLANGSYTVSPSLTGYTFNPTSTPVTVNGANVVGISFTATAVPTYKISGTISGASGVTVSLSGAATRSTTTDASGNYSFPGLANGSYTVSPSLTGYVFNPTSTPVTVNGADVGSISFMAIAVPTYTISGTVSGAIVSGVTMTLTGAANATTTTDGNGNYSFTGLANGSYAVTPSLSGYTFTPAKASVTVSGGNVPGTNFAATAMINHVATVIDAGPAGVNALNLLYTTVTVCAPGSTSACQTIDHVAVDTGSTGLRIIGEVLGNGLTSSQLTQATDASGNAIVECTQFADGYSWGPVKIADMTVGGETAKNLSVQVIGDSAYPSSTIPTKCKNAGVEENTVAAFGANAILGIGNFVHDCGAYCTSGTQDGSLYNTCTSPPSVVCQPATVPLSAQVSNPIASFASDNNGAVIQLPSVASTGDMNVPGTLYFGIGTQSNNGLGSATVYTVDSGYGTVHTTYKGTVYTSSYVDSGSNGYFFPDASISTCAGASWFYCPAQTSVSLSATLAGLNGKTKSIGFTVSDPFKTLGATATADPNLGGPAGKVLTNSFIWGLPLFFGRSVYVVLEGQTVGGVQGPAIAF